MKVMRGVPERRGERDHGEALADREREDPLDPRAAPAVDAVRAPAAQQARAAAPPRRRRGAAAALGRGLLVGARRRRLGGRARGGMSRGALQRRLSVARPRLLARGRRRSRSCGDRLQRRAPRRPAPTRARPAGVAPMARPGEDDVLLRAVEDESSHAPSVENWRRVAGELAVDAVGRERDPALRLNVSVVLCVRAKKVMNCTSLAIAAAAGSAHTARRFKVLACVPG